jgi:DNA-binding transcriptional regulator YhcF (GntR family)
MTANRLEPFQLALRELRNRLTAGAYASGARLTAGELAAELGLSPTPMREVLARLTGEGLLEDRRGQGFFLRRLSARDVADLYALTLRHLEIASEALRRAPAAPAADPPAATTPDGAIATADRLFARWVAEAGGAMLSRSFLRVQTQLAPVRRLEPRHLDDLVEEYERLATATPGDQRTLAVRRFFRRRQRVAGRLAEDLEPPLQPA